MKTTGFAIAAATLMMIMGCSQKKAENSAAFIGPSDIQVVEGAMTPETLLSFGRLSDPQLSPDGKWILYGVSYTSIEENRSCRNLFLQEVSRNEDGSLVFGDKIQLTGEGKSVGNARWSLDGGHIFFTQGGQIWKAEFKGEGGKPVLGEKVRLSDVEGGVGEFLLSPDQTQVLYTSTVPGAVKTPKDFDPSLDKAKAYVTEDLAYRHWDHWTTERPQTYVATIVEGVEITKDKSLNILDSGANKFELPIEPFSGIEQLCWSPDGQMVAYSCKKVDTGREYAFSTDTEIYIYKIITGETVRIEMDGGYDTDPVWSPDGKHIAWISMARNGYEADKTRLMVADLASVEQGGDGQTAIPGVLGVRELTADFKYNAEGPVWAADSRTIYFASLTEGLKAIYKVDAVAGAFSEEGNRLDIAVIPVRITPDDAWYDFNSPFAVVDGTLLASYASMEFPTELVAVNEGDGSFSRISDENGHILGQLDPCSIEERWITTVDGKKMLTWVLYPPKFDSTKVYPAVEIFLGGPQGTLSQGWSYRWNYRLMASQGYIVILPNRRGTTAFGQEWCEQISGDYIGLNMQDYLSAARELKKEPYVGKLAGCGASYGGFSVYYMAGIHGDVYDCFIAHAGIFDEKYMYYETEEMWFPNWDNGGLTEYSFTPGEQGPRGDGKTFGGIQQAGSPWSNAPKAVRHYSNSPAVNVTKWHTPILCIHGMMDYRIPYDQGMAAFNAAQMMGVPSKLIVFPEENHWILQPQNALFWHRSYFDWLDRWCR
ncbi:MAG: S9 family peptidase [Bacteroidales bacterium]|nr:S9 family peptidase [Bacteroidales bacterium]